MDAQQVNVNHGRGIIVGSMHDYSCIIVNPQPPKDDFNYDVVIKAFRELYKASNHPDFDEAFPENSDEARAIIVKALNNAQKRKEPKTIRDNIKKLGSLADNTAGSLIAAGIIEMLKRLLSC
ncbi:MAG: hypothetical protein FWC93_02905 [Defluviitaleaceae bacterium]|nr:hypothetical protein [Defluviitaleaceae bacterium]